MRYRTLMDSVCGVLMAQLVELRCSDYGLTPPALGCVRSIEWGNSGALQRASNRHSVPVEFMIFVITTLAGAKLSKIVYKLDGCNPFDHLEPKLVFAT